MADIDIRKIISADTSRAVEIGERVWWVGQYLPDDIFQCNAYLIERGNNSVLIDPGGHLTFESVRKKVEEVVPFSSIRYFICHHQDPDITASLKLIEEIPGLHPEAAIVTHWRARALIKHYALRLPIIDIEESGWQLDLDGRLLLFVFTPYLHFPGAFCTYDVESGILFSSDIFGGMTREWSLVARDESYFEDIRPFHEHYMPSREILLHGLLKLEELPVRMIAPQHGSILYGGLISFVIGRLKQLECGIFALAGDSTDIRRLSFLNKTLKDITNTVIVYRDFRDIANALLDILKRTLPAVSIEFYAKTGNGEPLCLSPGTRYRGAIEEPPAALKGVLGVERGAWAVENGGSYRKMLIPAALPELKAGVREWALVIPLFPREGGRAGAMAVIRLAHDVREDRDLDRMLGEMSGSFAIAVEREAFYRMLEAERCKFYEQSIKDPLTGLYTRFYMDETLKRLAHAHDRNGQYAISVVLFDLDHFKDINEGHGHAAGDEAIRQAASAMLGSIRASDIAVRYGGEEFAVFLMGNTPAECVIVAEKIRRKLAGLAFEGQLEGLKVTASAGVAIRMQKEPVAEFLGRADRALFQAKSSGRNRVVYLE
ncbi:MAG: diguanylate cyclase [Deltaproteobacteria bacterium]|nr:diguanylate cyclase [Deltaproteobacteria bacterium]MCL4873787.1 diguanylate cyclase [bacterium]